ncbi:MAG: sporulation protein [Eubacterium sp.]|nr:sporulation protein [Eubacterium sp.]
MAENNFKQTVQTLFEGMDSFISSKTVVGDPIRFGDTIILPLVDVTFGIAAGAFADNKKNNGGGGMGGKIVPSCALVIKGDKIKLVNIRNQDGLTKILDLVPDIVDKIAGKHSGEETAEQKEAKEQLQDMILDATNFEEE